MTSTATLEQHTTRPDTRPAPPPWNNTPRDLTHDQHRHPGSTHHAPPRSAGRPPDLRPARCYMPSGVRGCVLQVEGAGHRIPKTRWRYLHLNLRPGGGGSCTCRLQASSSWTVGFQLGFQWTGLWGFSWGFSGLDCGVSAGVSVFMWGP